MRRSLSLLGALVACGSPRADDPPSGVWPAADAGARFDAPRDDAPRDDGPRLNRAFVSQVTRKGDFGGVAAADALCQGEATAAGLPGTFVALLGDGAALAPERLKGSRGWADVSGAPIVELPGGWLDAHMLRPLALDATGARVDADTTYMWIGGLGASATCDGWTSTADAFYANFLNTYWRYDLSGYSGCSFPWKFVCVEVGRAVPVVAPPAGRRRAFVTRDPWISGGGRADADARCGEAAQAAGLAGNYLAYLSTSTEDAWQRFEAAGGPWARVDGWVVADAATLLAGPAGGPLQAFWALDEHGVPVAPQDGIGTGSRAGSRCADWTSRANGDLGRLGKSANVEWKLQLGWGDGFDVPCDDQYAHLLCLER